MLSARHLLLLAASGLLALGLLMVHSAAMDPAGATWWLAGRRTLHAALAIAAMVGASLLPARRLEAARWSAVVVIGAFLAACALVLATRVPSIGHSVHGAARWIRIGPLTFQPSELLKWALPALLALWAARLGPRVATARGAAPMIGVVFLAAGLIVVADLGTAALVGAVGMGVLVAAGVRWRDALAPLPVAAAALVWSIAREPYRVERLTAFLDPWAEPKGAGYHPIQSMVAVAQGGWTGRGLGTGAQKLGFLPADSSDFVFAVICEELGVAGAALVVGLFAALVWSGIVIARRGETPFARIFALGVIGMVGAQALMNMAVVTVLVPPKGIALPLVSEGGTGWVAIGASLGLVAALDPGPSGRADDAAARPREAVA